jgi:hypothetical protein
MDSKTKIADLLRWFARLAGTIALILGILFWLGMLVSLVRVHSILGIITAISLALIAVTALAAGARAPMALVGIVWAAATLFIGFRQNTMLLGESHWIIQVIHLLLGVGAIGMAEALGAGIRKRPFT